MNGRELDAQVAGLSGRRRLSFLGQVARSQLRDLPELLRLRGRRPTTAGLELRDPPWSRLTEQAQELLLDVAPAPILHHSLRCWYLGDLLGQVDGLEPDPEQLFLACALHDLGLTPTFRPPPTAECFALHGADLAAARVLEWGGSEDSAEAVRHAIARHVDVEGDTSTDTSFLLHEAAYCDVVGARSGELPRPCLDVIHERHPRTELLSSFVDLMREEARWRPRSRGAILWRSGMIVRMRLNPLDDHY